MARDMSILKHFYKKFCDRHGETTRIPPMWNCSEIDGALTGVQSLVLSTSGEDGEWAFVLLVGGVGVVGALLLVAGETLVQPMGAVVGGVGGFVGAFLVTSLMEDMSCDWTTCYIAS